MISRVSITISSVTSSQNLSMFSITLSIVDWDNPRMTKTNLKSGFTTIGTSDARAFVALLVVSLGKLSVRWKGRKLGQSLGWRIVVMKDIIWKTNFVSRFLAKNLLKKLKSLPDRAQQQCSGPLPGRTPKTGFPGWESFSCQQFYRGYSVSVPCLCSYKLLPSKSKRAVCLDS